MYNVTVNRDICEGCGECAENCPVSLFEMVDGKAEVTGDMEECLGCETCVSVCPSGAVKVEEA
ncbi:MAG: 4Fe-4S binding protein [Peptococcaceae bacterium]|nr:4Fe-4S binding protein [Peptococcaceae bacterium]